jgi:TnpA family transposase
MVFTFGTLLGPAQVAAHMRGKISAAEIAMTANKHSTSDKISKASTDVINEFNKLDIASVWGDGKTVAADGSQIETLATISPYITQVIRRFGNWILNLTPPAADPTARLDLESQVLFAP